MICRVCRVWTLAEEDNFCSWCGTAYLLYQATLAQNDLAVEEYPPPVELVVHNTSETAVVVVEALRSKVPWITLVPTSSLPLAIAPGTHGALLLDVDTFAAGSAAEAEITLEVAYGAPRTLWLRLTNRTPSGPTL